MATAVSAGAGEKDLGPAAPMSHRQIMEALSGLLIGLFVAILSSTVVSNALPTIVADLRASQTTYTWVVTSTLLATTVSTPIWGKLADLTSKKALVQLGLVVFVAGSAVAGLARDPAMLITARVIQGVGAGGLTALVQVIMAAMIAPRERGRYSGYIGAVFALATIGGPLVGGVIVDTSWLGWRWCFYVGVPFAVLALVVLQKTLHLPVSRREVKVDWAGATLIAAAVSLLLVWVSFAGHDYAWLSWQTGAMLGGAVALALLFLFAEARTTTPIVPLHLFRNRTVSLAVVSSLLIGVALFGATTFLGQYFQLARGESPSRAGVMTLPLIIGLALASTVAGRIITATGRWKALLVAGGLSLTGGFDLMSMIRHTTPYWQVAIFMVLVGVGLGMTMQNLVLSVQNQVRPHELGAASSLVSFFRTLGGAMGVSALGAVLSSRVARYTADGLAAAGVHAPAGGGGIPRLSALPGPVRTVVEDAFGHGIGNVFAYTSPAAFLALIAVLFIKEVPLRGTAGEPGTGGRHAVASGPEPAAHLIHGSVRDAAGLPVTHAALTLIDSGGRQVGRTVTRDDGWYALPAPGPGTYVLITSAGGRDPQATTVVAGDRADLTLGGSYGLTGTVRGIGGEPVRDARVVLTDARGEIVATGTTDAGGAYAIPRPAGDDHTLTVSAAAHRPAAITVRAGDGPARQDVELAPGGRLGGIVRAAGYGPLADARVTLLDADGNVAGVALTGPDGRYAFAGLADGRYTLTASGYPPVAGTITLDGRGEEARDLRLGHPTR
jgi:EmrB/QacA subfamily drug resistance transporter